MKTIEQASTEYANTKAKVVVSGTEITNTIDDLNLFSQTDFEEGANFAQEWISVEDELPKSLKKILIRCLSDSGKSYTTMAQFVKAHTVKADDFLDTDYSEGLQDYDELEDEFYVTEGWFEYQTETDINWAISSIVTHWRPIERE